MECSYCGKELKGQDGEISFYIEGKLVQAFCNWKCQSIAYKKMKRLIKKMSREELMSLIEKKKKESKK